MKTFLQYINEVTTNDITRRSNMHTLVGTKIGDRNAEKHLGKKTFTYNGQHVHVRDFKDGSGKEISVRHPETGKIVAQIHTSRMGGSKKAGHIIDTAAAKGLKGGMDGLYHHLLKKGAEGHEHGLTSIVGDNQSHGAQKVWTKLSTKPNITVHGWDHVHHKPINLGKKLDTDETHVSHSDYKGADPEEHEDLKHTERMKVVASYHKPVK